MIKIRPNQERGRADFGWLQSQHSFSFGSYYDAEHLHFSALRVINDDHVAPEAGFHTHSHRDMEIISYVLEGEIAHKDSEGNIARLPAGEFQLMSAGKGIAHSEFNPSSEQPLHFLQIWIQPNVYGQEPGYQQKPFGQQQGLTLVASPDGQDGSLLLKQDAKLYQLILPAQASLQIPAAKARRYYLHLISGNLLINDIKIQPGDGVKIEDMDALALKSTDQAVQALWFDLP